MADPADGPRDGLADGLTPAEKLRRSALVAGLLAVAAAGSLWPRPVARPLQRAGLQQAWGVFAPDPVHRETAFEAVVLFADGSRATWRPPRASAVAAHRSHRWEMWQDRIVDDAYSPWWEEAARFVAARYRGDGREPVRVSLRRRWSDLPRPGLDPALRAWNDFEFYALDL